MLRNLLHVLTNAEEGSLKKALCVSVFSLATGNLVKTGKRAGGVRSQGRSGGHHPRDCSQGGRLIGVPFGHGFGLLFKPRRRYGGGGKATWEKFGNFERRFAQWREGTRAPGHRLGGQEKPSAD